MSGTQLAESLGQSRPELPVLVVSGYAESEGIAAHLPRLSKPFRKDQLAASLSELPQLRTVPSEL
jgi:FixJ family two-component response regulator